MVEITVNKGFYDVVEKVDRRPGDTFEATEERAEFIDSALPGYVTFAKAEKKDDLSKLTVAQLTKLAGERGIEVPKGTRKAELLEILEG